MFRTYFKVPIINEDELASILKLKADTFAIISDQNSLNVVGAKALVSAIVQGLIAEEEKIEDEGVIPAHAAVGDPTYKYLWVDFYFPLGESGNITFADKSIVETLCGV